MGSKMPYIIMFHGHWSDYFDKSSCKTGYGQLFTISQESMKPTT